MKKKTNILRFSNENDLLSAFDKIGRENISEILSPYPLNIKSEHSGKSYKIGIVAFVVAMIIVILSILFQYWTSSVDYQLNIGGRDFFSLISTIPITYELGILFAGFAAFAGFLFFSHLPKWREKREEFHSLSDDFIIILNDNNIDDFTELLKKEGIEYRFETN